MEDLSCCRVCGAVGDPTGPDVLGWARDRLPDGRVGWLCAVCVRRHVRDIEAKLPEGFWS